MKKKSSGADDVESDDDSEDEDAGLPDADTSAATEVKDASVPGADKPKTEIAGLASLRSLFEGTQNDPPMPVDYLRGVNSKCVRTCVSQLTPTLTLLQASFASPRSSFILSCRRVDIRCVWTRRAN